MIWIPTILLGALLAGSWVFCLLVVVAARSYRKVRPAPCGGGEPISVLKPLHGLDEGLETNLRTFFEQDYEPFEILFAAREEDDEGLALARRLSAEYPRVHARFFAVGEAPYANAKVWSLERMTGEARCDLLVMSDSDIRVEPWMLATLAAEFADPSLGVATCPYRAVAGASVWSRLEAAGMNTEFWGGALVARLVEGGVKFAVGPTIAARRGALASAGGWRRLSEYLAEDFVLGQLAARAGWGVILSSYVIEHRIGSQAWKANFAHRLRWCRSTRRSRPSGYVGQIFTFPLPLALAWLALRPEWWWVVLPAVAWRAWAAWEVSWRVLDDAVTCRAWWLVVGQDLLSFGFWLAGFFGRTIEWRGRRYRLQGDGRFQLAD
jgi:ceramide glucosyltransferase